MTYEIRQVPWLTPSVEGLPTYIRGGNTPEAIVLHKMQGWVTTAIGWAVKGEFGRSWHFSIRLDGVIYQHLTYADGGYHAGITDNQGRTYPPTWALWKGIGRNVNTYTIGIELEGFSGNAIPTKQRDALKWLLDKICDETGIRYDRDHLPPHADIDTVNRVNDFDYPEGRDDLYLYLLTEDEMTPDEKARMERLERIVGGPAADDIDLLVSLNNLNAALTTHVDTPHGGDGGGVPDHEHTVTGVAQ